MCLSLVWELLLKYLLLVRQTRGSNCCDSGGLTTPTPPFHWRLSHAPIPFNALLRKYSLTHFHSIQNLVNLFVHDDRQAPTKWVLLRRAVYSVHLFLKTHLCKFEAGLAEKMNYFIPISPEFTFLHHIPSGDWILIFHINWFLAECPHRV